MIKIKVIYRLADTLSCRLVYALFIYVVIAGVGGFYRRRLHYFLRTCPRRQKNHTYCVKCSPSRATPSPRRDKLGPPCQGVCRLLAASDCSSQASILGLTDAFGGGSMAENKYFHGSGGRRTRMDDGGRRKGIIYYSYVCTHCKVF